ncbi:uncharacterized protein DDB_G0285291 [Stomoxys calcitrans]|uniref:DUF243 domain-containing protein n=1 Tax=Stomoxys calcitrans TaxID=35570 RepID=A0A1I8P811_STOCA|nr:uncharacterized protein DDB_G0285291 [Stomoxys calcitrans]
MCVIDVLLSAGANVNVGNPNIKRTPLHVICLCATALAAPQGYNYQQQTQQGSTTFGGSSFNTQSTSNSGPSSLINHSAILQEALKSSNLQNSLGGVGGQIGSTQQFSSSGPQFTTQSQAIQQQQQQSFGFPNVQQQPAFTSSFGGQQIQPQFPNYQQHHQQQFQNPATVTKDIYVHVAPEEGAQQQYQQPLPQAPPRKHYRIVFIKAPSQDLSKTALRINQAPVEEKTIIYVLTKKADPLDLQAAIQETQPSKPSKPEVYFIKYKTQEEAQHAQRTIQAQYDQLGGTTQVSDEGIAPVTSVIGSLDGQQGNGGGANFGTQSVGSFGPQSVGTFSSSSSSYSSSASGGSTSNASKYLPPIVKL